MVVDDIAIWQRELTADEVATIYEEGDAGTALVDIVEEPPATPTPVPAVPVDIDVENFSFELPGTEKTWFPDPIPGWTTDPDNTSDSGVEVDYAGAEAWRTGDWNLFIMGEDASVWQTTTEVIAAGAVYTLVVDCASNWIATEATLSLYADDGVARTILVSEVQEFADDSIPYAVEVVLDADDYPEAIGDLLGPASIDSAVGGQARRIVRIGVRSLHTGGDAS